MTAAVSNLETTRLSDLQALDRTQLDALFASGETPSMRELEGDARGLLISGVANLGLDHPLGRRLLSLCTAAWSGKWFLPWGELEGEGGNILDFGLFQRRLLNFRSRIGLPLEGGRPVFILDYDQVGNDPLTRRMRDDIRRIGDNLYLGTGNFRWRGRYRFVSYFALERLPGND